MHIGTAEKKLFFTFKLVHLSGLVLQKCARLFLLNLLIIARKSACYSPIRVYPCNFESISKEILGWRDTFIIPWIWLLVRSIPTFWNCGNRKHRISTMSIILSSSIHLSVAVKTSCPLLLLILLLRQRRHNPDLTLGEARMSHPDLQPGDGCHTELVSTSTTQPRWYGTLCFLMIGSWVCTTEYSPSIVLIEGSCLIQIHLVRCKKLLWLGPLNILLPLPWWWPHEKARLCHIRLCTYRV